MDHIRSFVFVSCISFISLQLHEYDNLPNFICVDCWMRVKKFYEFYQNVISAQTRFLSEFKATVKVETENHYEEISFADACK